MRFLLFCHLFALMSGLEFGTQKFVVFSVQFIGYRQSTMSWTETIEEYEPYQEI